MKIAIVNLTGGGISGGYRKYLRNMIPRMVANSGVEALLCASAELLNVQGWFDPLPNIDFVNFKTFRFLYLIHDSELHRRLEKFSPATLLTFTFASELYKLMTARFHLSNADLLINM